MESPVRICLGAVLVINIVLLQCSIPVSSNALPYDLTTVKSEKATKFPRANSTAWAFRNRGKTPDVALNELNPRETVLEVHTEKNFKHVQRGTTRYQAQPYTTESLHRRFRSTTEAPTVLIVTPKLEAEKSSDTINSKKLYKEIKLSSSSVSSLPLLDTEAHGEEYDDEPENDENTTFEKYTHSLFTDSNNDFFTIPSFNYSGDSDKKASESRVKKEYTSPSFDTYASYFPDHNLNSYSFKEDNTYKSESYFDFNSELTTPKNDFFDKIYERITNTIQKNLRERAKTSPASNTSNLHTIINEKISNGTPNNKSTVIIKNTKEIRLTDNDKEGTVNKQLRDVHGTSIYYEMSVLSTETYAINQSSDDDCDPISPDPTLSTSVEEELASIKTTEPTLLPDSTKTTIHMIKKEPPSPFVPYKATYTVPEFFNFIQTASDSNKVFATVSNIKPEQLPKLPSTLHPFSSSDPPLFSNTGSIALSTQNSVSTTDKTAKYLSNFRNRNYSKRLNSTGNNDTPNSLPIKTEQPSSHHVTRKFHFTTQKPKRWMAPTRNVTRTFIKPIRPTTIYSEHFNVKDKVRTTPKYRLYNRTLTLTTASSDKINPVLQTDIGGVKKVVHTQSISDNSIPTLWKRGSTKFLTTTLLPEVQETSVSEMDIPPTMTAWALASMISPPASGSTANTTKLTQKNNNIDDNELQSVGEVLNKKETTSSTTSTVATTISNELYSKKKVGIFQNKFPTKLLSTTSSSTEVVEENLTDPKPETLNAESSESLIASAQGKISTTIEAVDSTKSVTEELKPTKSQTDTLKPALVPASDATETTTEEEKQESTEEERILPVDGKMSTGFESITKLPSDFTTPQDETDISDDKIFKNTIPTTPDYKITTIRFTYVPTEEVTEDLQKEKSTTDTWHPFIPTRTRFSSFDNIPVTTYRPSYVTKTESKDETTAFILETTPQLEVSSQIIESTPSVSSQIHTTEMTNNNVIEKVTLESSMPLITTTTTTEPSTIEITTVEEKSATSAETYKSPTETTSIIVETTVNNVEKTVFAEEKTVNTEEKTVTTEVKPETTEEKIVPTEKSTITTEETTVATEETTFTSEETTVTVEETTFVPLITTYLPVETTITSINKTSLGEVTTLPIETTTSSILTNIPLTNTTALEETTRVVTEIVTEINSERDYSIKSTTEYISTTQMSETSHSEIKESSSEENSGSNVIIPQETTSTTTTHPTTMRETTTAEPTTRIVVTVESTMETRTPEKTNTPVPEFTSKETTTPQNVDVYETTTYTDTTMEATTHKLVSDPQDVTSYTSEATTETSSRVLNEEAGSGAAVAITVSTIGVIALVLLVGLLLVVRRRGRRGVYAQRCTPVSMDAYSLDSVSVGHRKGTQRLRASKRSYGNPAYDDEVTSHPMQYAALANFSQDITSIGAEFAEIPSINVRPEEVPPGCEDKNRYSNVLPLPETRVPLSRIGNDPTTEYINANYITGPGNIRNYYIACQAPLPNTVVDFWRMIWEQDSRVIVMLTEYMENGVEKCYEYLPPSEISDNKRTFGEYQVVLKKREQHDKYAISSVQLINLTTRSWREITHLWYFWPAKGVPDDYDSVIDFLFEMRSYMKVSQSAKEYDEDGVEIIYGDERRSSFHTLSKLRSEESSGNGVNTYSPAKAEEKLRKEAGNNGTLGRVKAAAELEAGGGGLVRPCTLVCASGAGRSAALVALDLCARALAAAGAADVPRVVRELRAQRPHALTNKHHYIFLYKVLSEYGNKLMGAGVDNI